ncbi:MULTISPECIES: helix-turn-helix domain-containing protein [Peptostreptococcus]|uniref:DNA-binding helix-turn-helix protein n=1 Tax=Peptostreptococcus anaerobius TaxID=1261 RepID=A0A135YZ86_9FIRM|nr:MULTISPECIES: helix-turn-helix transcriptional regulator [Peptostreptococcus]KXI14699.1 DNA-binding helix-turn-helix protein [Peptostreptococcus anaerobius]MDU1265880.1 helix-turn-helix transcriptional regulator [Peptostreptococcus sp.]
MPKHTLKEWRNLRGMSRRELSKQTGISERTIQNYEENHENIRKASIKNIESLAMALGIKMDDIFLLSTSIL